MARISELLARRSDLSTFVVHLTRRSEQPARQNLESILRDGCVFARSAFGPAAKALADRGLHDCLACQQVVCFTETPLEHIHLLLEPITDLSRACEFEPYGIATTKRLARDTAVNPVWYTDITPKGHDWLMNSVNALITQAVDNVVTRRAGGDAAAHFKQYDVAKLAPFIEQMGSGSTTSGRAYQKEFWWEREWRHRGDYLLPIWFIVLAPAEEHEALEALMQSFWGCSRPLLDPRWGLEEIIGRLAGFSEIQIKPF